MLKWFRLPEGAIRLARNTRIPVPAGGTLVNGARTAFEIGGVQYARNWMETASAPELVDLGIVQEDRPTPPAPPPYQPTVDDVERERDRRLAEGFDYDFGDSRDVHHIGTTAEDMTGWNEVTLGALANVAGGNSTATFDILTDTGPAQVTAAEWLVVMDGAKQFRQPIWNASFAIAALDPIPSDYDAESRWTA